MAEKVTVKGGGTIDGAQFENAATEATLRELIKTVKDTKCCGEGGDKKLQDLFSRALREYINGVNDSTTAQQDSTKEIGLLGKAAKTTGSLLTSGLSALAGGMISGVVTAGETLFKFFTDSLDAFRETSSVGASFNNDLVLLRRTAADAAMPLGEFTLMISKNSKLMASLGGTVTQGAMEFANMSKQMRVSDFGTQMMGMGMTMGDINDYLSGYLEIQQRSGKVQGKSQQELIAGAESYALEMDKLTKVTGLSRQQTQDTLRTAMKDGRALTLASRLSGDALTKFQSDLTLMNSTINPEAMGSLTDMMMGTIQPGDKFAKFLMQAAPGVEDFERAIGKGQLSTEQVVQGNKDQLASIKRFLSNYTTQQIDRMPELQKLAQYASSLEKFNTMDAKSAAEQQIRQNKITEALGSFGQMWQKFVGDLTVQLVDSGVFKALESGLQVLADKFLKYGPQISTAITGLIGDLDKAFQGNDLIDGLGNAFSVLFDKLTPIVGALFKGLFESLTGKSGKRKELEDKKRSVIGKIQNASDDDPGGNAKLGEELTSIKKELEEMDNIDPFKELSKTLSDMFPIIGQIQGAVATVTDLFKNWGTTILAGGGIIVALGALNALIGGAGKGLGKAIGGLGEGIGTLIGSIGKGLGTAIGGILTGVGEGLAFLGGVAGPMVIGAGALGVAIGLIGTGIAGATWIIGKALPTFAEGMAGFQNLNGDNLIKVGAGIGAIGLAMAAMGVGSAVGGIGNMLGGLADGITSLFGGKTPFDKLQEFSKYDIDTEKVKSNSQALVAYSTAMAALGAGGAIGSLGGLVSAVADGLTKFFGGNIKLPWDRMIEFQNVALDMEKIGRNSEAVIAFSKAISNLPDIKTESSGGVVGAIGSFFSGSQVMPWDKLKEFGEMKFNRDKIVQNAEILKLFGDSMNTFSNAGSPSITNVGTDFATQATGINTFTDSIKNLNKAITDLNTSLATISSAGKGMFGGGPSNLEVVSQALGGANTGGSVASEKLNTLVTELVNINKQIRDFNKDQADALSGRRSPL